jgi:quercetin dioxygenase-like cupin family protein
MGGLRYAVLGGLMSLAMAVPASAGDVIVVEYSQGKTPIIVKKDSFSMGDVPNMGEGKPNKGFSYATAFELPGVGVQIARGRVEPKGTIAVHDGKQQYILYVIGGTGKLTLHDLKGAQVGETTYKPDDVIVFQTNPNHGWINGDTAFEFLGVDLPVLRK